MKSCCKEIAEGPVKKKSKNKWLKSLGIAGFLFFLIKGLAWVAVLYGGFTLMGC